MSTSLDELETPCLLLDGGKLRRNAARLAAHVGALDGTLRPHVKTHKCLEVARLVEQAGHTRGITVSTLREADYFFANGFDDILYAVGITPNKLEHAARLIKHGCRLQVIVDSVAMAVQCAEAGAALGVDFAVLIELDTDGHRAGVAPEGDRLPAIGRVLHEGERTQLLGVMTHAGESYACDTPAAQRALARVERDRSLLAARRLQEIGLPCPVVSVGSTPTALAIDDLEGVTEVRAGVYTFFDLVMAGIGVCQVDDIALSVLVSVNGHQPCRNWLLTDGGWMALSRDRGTQGQRVDQGYGLVVSLDGAPVEDLIVSSANQEHGIVGRREGNAPLPWTTLPVGSLLRVLPNHACATAAQFEHYVVVEGRVVVDRWMRVNGW